MIETPDVGTTATTVTTAATVATVTAAEPSNEEDGAVIQEDNEAATEREITLLQESQGWWFPKTKLSAWVSLRQLRVRSRQSTIFVAAASFIAVPQDK